MDSESTPSAEQLPCGKSLAEIVAGATGTSSVRIVESPRIAHPAKLAIVGLALGALAEIFLYQNSLGIGLPLFVLCLVGAIFAVGRWEDAGRPRWRNALPLAAACVFFAAMSAVRAGSWITALNIACSLRLLTLLLGMFTRADILQIGVTDLLGMPWRIGERLCRGASPIVSALKLPGHEARNRQVLPLLRGLLIAVPVLAVLIPLLASADALFAAKVAEVGRWLFPMDYWDRILRIAFMLVVAWASIGGIAYAVSAGDPSKGEARPRRSPGYTEAMTVLALVNTVFLSFVALQFRLLFGGAHQVSVLPAAAYTAYVHSGFGQLICVSLISLVLISAFCAALAPAGLDSRRRVFLNGNGVLMLGLTLIILFSAAQRMRVYEVVYGATITRMWVDDLIACIGIALLWRGVTLYTRKEQSPSFGAGALACVVGFGIALNLQNPEAAAVQTNLTRYQTTGNVANFFFNQTFSVDAVHDVIAAFHATSGPMHDTIGARLRMTLDDLVKQHQDDRWPAWHAGRASALGELLALAPELPTAKRANEILGSDSAQ